MKETFVYEGFGVRIDKFSSIKLYCLMYIKAR